MHTLFMNSGNIKMSDSHRLLLSHSDYLKLFNAWINEITWKH